MNIRGIDQHGSGAYRAPRRSKLHRGVDICCEHGEAIEAVSSGRITKIGYPYSQAVTEQEKQSKKKALRYVQITDKYGISVRYFYVLPSVAVGYVINTGDELGIAQGLAHIYPGITEHYHFEVLMMVNGKKVFLDPDQYLAAVKAKQDPEP